MDEVGATGLPAATAALLPDLVVAAWRAVHLRPSFVQIWDFADSAPACRLNSERGNSALNASTSKVGAIPFDAVLEDAVDSGASSGRHIPLKASEVTTARIRRRTFFTVKLKLRVIPSSSVSVMLPPP